MFFKLLLKKHKKRFLHLWSDGESGRSTAVKLILVHFEVKKCTSHNKFCTSVLRQSYVTRLGVFRSVFEV